MGRGRPRRAGSSTRTLAVDSRTESYGRPRSRSGTAFDRQRSSQRRRTVAAPEGARHRRRAWLREPRGPPFAAFDLECPLPRGQPLGRCSAPRPSAASASAKRRPAGGRCTGCSRRAAGDAEIGRRRTGQAWEFEAGLIFDDRVVPVRRAVGCLHDGRPGALRPSAATRSSWSSIAARRRRVRRRPGKPRGQRLPGRAFAARLAPVFDGLPGASPATSPGD
jgi:hypothetical protein